MDDDFNLQSNDTVPITPSNGETTPLKGSLKRLDKRIEEKATSDIGHNKSDSVGKYKNFTSDVTDPVEETNVNAVRLQFAPRDNTSVWSLNSSTASSGAAVVRWYKHPKVREHWKVVVASFVLFFIGLCLCVTGIILEALQVKLSGIFMLFVIGVICFIPGVYHVIAVYYAVKGKRGFSFYNLPLFN
uniref:Transmembrane protein 134-like n=1 Tax=Phallusia mammillata TaxID=59560 RepID=A0A6F9DUB4_9ASCI|nr:transmembrane protein 134-like [Phallusia mammillata]